MEVILGGISSLLYGVADFLGGEGAKRAPAAAIVLWAGVISFPMILVVALVVGGDAGPSTSCSGQQPGSPAPSVSCPCSPGSAGATPLP